MVPEACAVLKRVMWGEVMRPFAVLKLTLLQILHFAPTDSSSSVISLRESDVLTAESEPKHSADGPLDWWTSHRRYTLITSRRVVWDTGILSIYSEISKQTQISKTIAKQKRPTEGPASSPCFAFRKASGWCWIPLGAGVCFVSPRLSPKLQGSWWDVFAQSWAVRATLEENVQRVS